MPMFNTEHDNQDHVLYLQNRWMVGLRWLAGAAVLVGAAFDAVVTHWFAFAPGMVALGCAILAYNAALWWLIRRRGRRTMPGQWIALIQIALDLVCLTLVAQATGGTRSPLLGLFALHMVAASFLLVRPLAYAAVGAAAALMAAGLAVTGQWPDQRIEALIFAGWVVSLLGTVLVSNHITRSLRRHRRRLLRHNRRVRALADRLRRQQEALVQHEKVVTMGQMAAGVAHEIANPLANIDGVLQMAERRPDSFNGEKIQTLREQVRRISRTVSQLTDFAHPADDAPVRITLNALADQCLELVRFDRRTRQVQVQRDYAADDPPMLLAAQAVQQAMVNLLINAVDAVADAPEPRVTLATHCGDGEERLTVRDNGPGISETVRAHIFEPFYTTKQVGRGTGLGLAISQRLINQIGGRIEVDTEPGKGTSMHVILPHRPADEPRS